MAAATLKRAKPATAPVADEAPPVGHNNPPEPTPLENAKELLSLLDVEASAWFDGEPIKNHKQADEVARLIDAARKAKQQFDNDRKAEKKPHDDAAKAVDAAWKPVISAAERILDVAKRVQTSWLIKLDEEKRAKEEKARREAEEKAAEARRLAEQSDGSLAAAKARDAAIEEAQRAEAIANRAANEKASAKGDGMSRAVGLRTVWHSEVQDRRALLNHIAKVAPQDLTAFVEEWAARKVRAGVREIPGVRIYDERVAA
jgi:hypothetical protein